MLHTPVEIGRRPKGAQTEQPQGAQTEDVVDSEAALEFMKEATKVATGTELEDIGERLEAKSRLFQEILAEERLATLDEADLKRLMAAIFTLRRKAGRLLRANGIEAIREELQELLYGTGPVTERFERFASNLEGLEKAMIVSLASEALHFTDPRRYWLWTYWIWNPKIGTGALPLVIQQEVDLEADSDGATYAKVGAAVARVNAAGHAVGYSRSGRGLFGTDVFLACVYAVYMFTVFRVKLSQEFNRILPELPELVQRVLGVRGLSARGPGEAHG
ncbi:MAG: hypothetical protein GY719_09190 [bacterium]|nr:hypothetical protein [bacterium]